MFTEDMGAKRSPSGGFGKDSIEVEGYVRGFARRRPDTEILTLRFANIVGPRIEARRSPTTSTAAGRPGAARVRRPHAVRPRGGCAATLGPAAGTVNVAGSGIITVSQAVSLAGRPFLKIPGPASRALSGVFKRTGLIDFSPEQLDLLVYGRGLDTTRMREVLGFEPHFTTREAFEDFVYSAPRPIDTAMHSAAGLAEDAGLWLRSVAGAIPIGRS
jgi:UDP-glucose 4-epimerase